MFLDLFFFLKVMLDDLDDIGNELRCGPLCKWVVRIGNVNPIL